ELGSADASEDPPHTFENSLPVHVLRQFFERIVAIAITLDRQASAVALHNQIDSKSANTQCGATRYPAATRHFMTSRSKGDCVRFSFSSSACMSRLGSWACSMSWRRKSSGFKSFCGLSECTTHI